MPLGASRADRSHQLRQLKQTVRRLLEVDEDTTILVRQLTCTEPGCPPLETVIAVLPTSGAARRWTLHSPLDQVTEDDLRTAFTTPPTTTPEGA